MLSFKFILNTYCKISNPQYQSKLNAHKCSKTKTAKGPPWRILFFGTDKFSLQSLKALCAKLRTSTLISSLGVVTKRHSLVCKFGEAENLPLYYWPVKSAQIRSLYDIGMVVSFGNLLTKSVIETLPLGCINVHASLLPRWRGAAPIIHAVLAGDNETGVTIMRIHPHKFDVGEIVRQYRISIDCSETAKDLEERLSTHGSNLLMECLRDLPKCVQKAVPQPTTGITYAPKVDQSMSVIKWDTTSAQSLYNLHRALSHIHHLRTGWHGQVVKLRSLSLEARLTGSFESLEARHTGSSESDQSLADSRRSALDFLLSGPSEAHVVDRATEAGRCFYEREGKSIKVVCADGRRIILHTLQIGNKVMSAADFYNGFMTKKSPDQWTFHTLLQ